MNNTVILNSEEINFIKENKNEFQIGKHQIIAGMGQIYWLFAMLNDSCYGKIESSEFPEDLNDLYAEKIFTFKRAIFMHKYYKELDEIGYHKIYDTKYNSIYVKNL